jgi:FkbM family methyltransferase
MYWSALLLPEAEYESELQYVLSRVLTPDTIFIDCGANFGYWSVFASTYLPPTNIIAIEAYPTTFDGLLLNSNNNGGFQCILSALSDEDGVQVWIGGNNHASMSLMKTQTSSTTGAWINSITLDYVLDTFVPLNSYRLVLKLDIEGLEIRVLSKSTRLLYREPLLLFEEHGKDEQCSTSQFILNELGYEIYHWCADKGIYKTSIEQILRLKKNKHIGYNFIACHPHAKHWLKDLNNPYYA